MLPMGMGGHGFGGGGFKIPSVGLRVNTSMFFDRAAIQASLSQMDRKALTKASLRVKDHAKRSIKKQGLAKPPTKLMQANPGVGLRMLAAMPNISPKQRKALLGRIHEIKTKPASPAGTPPHTHVPYGHMLGFRRNLWNFYDASTVSAVVGPSRKGKMLPYLHEFGGTQMLEAWAWKPKYPLRTGKMYMKWLSPGDKPRDPSKWVPFRAKRLFRYPARPFMQPALKKAIRNGDIAKAFEGAFRASSPGGAVYVGRP